MAGLLEAVDALYDYGISAEVDVDPQRSSESAIYVLRGEFERQGMTRYEVEDIVIEAVGHSFDITSSYYGDELVFYVRPKR